MIKKHILILFTHFIVFCSYGAHLTESSKVSLLTCSPSDNAIYSLFGHSGLRISDDSLGVDYVFDYGIFDFDTDNFIYRFVKGETDYMVGMRKYDHFIAEYSYRSVGVVEQILNLTLKERQNVFTFLLNNIKPENRTYRYNFFYDNCATRPRDIITENIEGVLHYTEFTEAQTYRDLLEECLLQTPWSRFGINLVIGSDADKIITERQKDFLPEYVSNALALATIKDQLGVSRPLVLETKQILKPEGSSLYLLKAKEKKQEAINYPLIVGLFFLLIVIIVSYLAYSARIGRGVAKIFDTLLFLSAGLAGTIIFFLMFFSEHPCVDKNWNLVWLNPVALLITPFFFVKSLTKYVISYHFVNFVALFLFIVGIAFVPQKIEMAFIPFILSLGLRSIENILWNKNGQIR